jgi:hypothetical protein
LIVRKNGKNSPEFQPGELKSIEQMLAILKSQSDVLGLVTYGSDQHSIGYAQGDFDLFVVVQGKDPAVESLHFYVAGMPVDLNLITMDHLRRLKGDHGFAFFALQNGRVIFDRSGALAYEMRKLRERAASHIPQELSQHEVAFIRHGHRHVFDKLRNRLESMPLTSRFLLHSNLYWLVVNYFQIRGLPFRGEKHALEYLRQFDPEIYKGLEEFYGAQSLEQQVEISRRLSRRVLRPIGGLWREDEVLAFGDSNQDDLQRRGMALFHHLFQNTTSEESPDGR